MANNDYSDSETDLETFLFRSAKTSRRAFNFCSPVRKKIPSHWYFLPFPSLFFFSSAKSIFFLRMFSSFSLSVSFISTEDSYSLSKYFPHFPSLFFLSSLKKYNFFSKYFPLFLLFSSSLLQWKKFCCPNIFPIFHLSFSSGPKEYIFSLQIVSFFFSSVILLLSWSMNSISQIRSSPRIILISIYLLFPPQVP